jgi:hypothetical protein
MSVVALDISNDEGVMLKIKERTTVTKQKELEIDHESLLALLRAAGYSVPEGADVVFHVPGGGDWSNVDVPVSKDDPVFVRWLETETK